VARWRAAAVVWSVQASRLGCETRTGIACTCTPWWHRAGAAAAGEWAAAGGVRGGRGRGREAGRRRAHVNTHARGAGERPGSPRQGQEAGERGDVRKGGGEEGGRGEERGEEEGGWRGAFGVISGCHGCASGKGPGHTWPSAARPPLTARDAPHNSASTPETPGRKDAGAATKPSSSGFSTCTFT
jgi:hypothetical protein